MTFSADWLAARRDADARARNAEIAARLGEHFSDRKHIQVLDLGCGTGANLAMTAPLLPNGQNWRMVDNDPDLLARIQPVQGTSHDAIEADLAGDLTRLFDPAPDLVTASALFDLAGRDFIDGLVDLTIRAGAVFFTVLTYDGQETWEPEHRHDAAVLKAFHADQHSDKGLGNALGPDATEYLVDRFRRAGYEVMAGQSDWSLTAQTDGRLIRMLADGIRRATSPALGDVATAWHDARKSTRRVRIGHKDLIALPPDHGNA